MSSQKMVMTGRTRVKYCGITRVEDALMAARLGVDAIGLVFYSESPRSVTIEQAQAILSALPPFITTVGLFVNADASFVEEVIEAVSIDLLQFHGEEPAEFCQKFPRPYIKVIRMKSGTDIPCFVQEHEKAQAILLDTFMPGQAGGTGQAFDWNLIPATLSKPIVLAGGLNVDNVAEAIKRVRPYAVDVSGGIEKEKGIKSPEKMKCFLQEVNKVGAS